MELTAAPELCTALTNLVNALAAFGYVLTHLRQKTLRARLWHGLMSALGGASLLGFFTHLWHWPARLLDLMWLLLSPMLCFACAMLALCAAGERGEARLRGRLRPVLYGCLAAALLTDLLLLLRWHFLFVTIFYGGVCVGCALADFIRRARRPGGAPCRWYLSALGAQLLGAPALLDPRVRAVICGVPFDHNSFYHAAALLTILLFWRGRAAAPEQV